MFYSLNFPVRSRLLAADADEPVSALRSRAQAPRVPTDLHKSGVLFAFSTAGLCDAKDFVKNAGRIAGAGERLGSLEAGKITDACTRFYAAANCRGGGTV